MRTETRSTEANLSLRDERRSLPEEISAPRPRTQAAPALRSLLAGALCLPVVALVVAVVVAVVVATAAAPAVAAASRVFRSEAYRIRSFTLPGTWELSSQGTYPKLLVAYAHGEGGRITIAAEPRGPAATAERLAVRTRPVLERQGFRELRLREEESRALLEGVLATDRRLLRQVYLCEGDFCYVLTLVAPAERPALVRDFDEAARGLVLYPPEARRD